MARPRAAAFLPARSASKGCPCWRCGLVEKGEERRGALPGRGAVIVGGHTVRDSEIKFGYAVTGHKADDCPAEVLKAACASMVQLNDSGAASACVIGEVMDKQEAALILKP